MVRCRDLKKIIILDFLQVLRFSWSLKYGFLRSHHKWTSDQLSISFIKIRFSCRQNIGETLFYIEWVSLQCFDIRKIYSWGEKCSTDQRFTLKVMIALKNPYFKVTEIAYQRAIEKMKELYPSCSTTSAWNIENIHDHESCTSEISLSNTRQALWLQCLFRLFQL